MSLHEELADLLAPRLGRSPNSDRIIGDIVQVVETRLAEPARDLINNIRNNGLHDNWKELARAIDELEGGRQ